jgi:hypothetical protein
MAYKKKSPIYMYANTNSIDEKTKVGPKVGGSVSGKMFSKKRIQEYKDRNWAMDHTTHSAIAAPKPPQVKNNITPTPYFPATKAKAPKAKAKAPKVTKGLVKQKAKAIETIKSTGITGVAQRPKAESIKLASPKQGLVGKKDAIVKSKAPKSTKLTRSQKLRAKGEEALASGKKSKARRIRKRYDRAVAREANK